MTVALGPDRFDPRVAPLRVMARLDGGVANPTRLPALDGLLAYAQAVYVEGRDPPTPGRALAPVEIPLVPAPCGRFHLASFAHAEVECYDERPRFVNRRFPIAEAQVYGDAKLRTINLSGGPCKSFRIPIETAHLVDDRVVWYAVGDPEGVCCLLPWITHLGKRRAVGLGKVLTWTVATPTVTRAWEGTSWTETRHDAPTWRPWDMAPDAALDTWRTGTWPTGAFPVLRDGCPTRNLPLDVMADEIARDFEGYGNVTFPYFEKYRESLCILAT